MILWINLEGHFVLAIAEPWEVMPYHPRQRKVLPFWDAIISFLNDTDFAIFVWTFATAAAAKSLQSCPTLCDPTRLPRPWDSPGKNTGVGCHFLLMKVKSESEVVQSCPTISDPMDCSLPGSAVHGIFQARVLEWGAIAFSRLNIYVASIFGKYSLYPLD